MSTPEAKRAHAQIIQTAAREVLASLGLQQKGRSRTWLDDRQWFVIVVEFQPSGFSLGSYLNVGCHWLWQQEAHLSYDLSGRPERFIRNRNEEQFRSAMKALGEHAAHNVKVYRTKFQTIDDLAKYYKKHPPVKGWPTFHAAIATGLSGNQTASQALFEAFLVDDDMREFAIAARKDARHLYGLIKSPEQFSSVIIERIKQKRELLKLPGLVTVPFC